MKPNDEEMAEKFPQAVEGLGHLSRALDSAAYSGVAWKDEGSAARPGMLRFRNVAAALIGIAAVIVLVVYLKSGNPSMPAPKIVKTPHMVEPSNASIPRILIIEDLDSYSIIDLTSRTPIVSFAHRTPPGMPASNSLLSDPVLVPSTQDSHF